MKCKDLLSLKTKKIYIKLSSTADVISILRVQVIVKATGLTLRLHNHALMMIDMI